MSDANWQKQQQEAQEYEEILRNDPGYQKWLDDLNTKHGTEHTMNFLNERNQK